jgi:hypothetical protein
VLRSLYANFETAADLAGRKKPHDDVRLVSATGGDKILPYSFLLSELYCCVICNPFSPPADSRTGSN